VIFAEHCRVGDRLEQARQSAARAIAARYDRFAGSFPAMPQLAAIRSMLHHAIRKAP
jgi:transposase